jgi:hypothetical protein
MGPFYSSLSSRERPSVPSGPRELIVQALELFQMPYRSLLHAFMVLEKPGTSKGVYPWTWRLRSVIKDYQTPLVGPASTSGNITARVVSRLGRRV